MSQPSARIAFSLLLLIAASQPSAKGAVSWSFDYTGSVEFDTSAVGMARRASLEAAAATAGTWFNHTATVTIAVSSSNEPGSSTLASAGSNSAGVFSAGFGSSGYVRDRILTGVGNPAGADGTVNVNFTHNWDLDDEVAADAFDFKSTMIHELLHATGFISEVTQQGNDTYSNAPGTPGQFSLFDKYLTDAAGTPIIDPSTFILNGAKWNSASVGSGAVGAVLANGVYFSGPKAMAGNGGIPVRIFSPNPWQEGSSGSHLDDLFYEAELMMKAATAPGPGARTLVAFERGMLEDIGYSMVGGTPPPATSALAAWRTTYFGAATALIGNNDDFDGDGKPNLLEFAIGTDPTLANSGPPGLEYTGPFAGGGTIAKTGQPVISSQGGDTKALYVRRKDRIAAGLTYTQRFSVDLNTWQNSSTEPVVLADDGMNEIVGVPFPAPDPAGKTFFRLDVNITP